MTWDDLSFMRFTSEEIEHMEAIGVSPRTVMGRINWKWTKNEIINVPYKSARKVTKQGYKQKSWNNITPLRFTDEEIEIMKRNNLKPQNVRKRHYTGWTKEEIINTEKFEHRKQAMK
ncbi:hypothetical protein K0017_05170 [Staphylococcus massiliensis]|uniref:hypothetical protein n=1 Tax=Staphylococcus massiliensis TaxID=555791 RepID=UPI001EDE4661|nr:hypothetical protein [Staphylococcus massiliensis]MCG3401710.1 hypothetical protein [Staphylococcus massiliensis]